jgi:PAS domain S-box-containing protein
LSNSRSAGVKALPAPLGDLARTLDSIPAGILLFDLTGNILHANQKSLSALGYELSELAGRHMEVLYRTSIRPDQAMRIRDAALERGWRGEVINYRKDGSSFPVFLETSLVRNDSGRPMAVIAVGRDISDQHAFQERLLVEAKLGTLGVLSHNLTHEIRNRLSALKLSLYMLQTGPSDGDQGVHFDIAREEINRIELFLRNLEAYVHPPQPRIEPGNLLEAVEQGIEDARPLLLAKSITVSRQFPGQPPRVHMDRRQLAQAVTQVAQNASEALPLGGELHVVVKRQPIGDRRFWLIELRDNGPGIAPSLQPRVFEPFFTTDSHRIGLGLSNVWRILSLHGGAAELACPPGRGTVVTLRLPEAPGES